MENIFINGTIYLKRKPTKLSTSHLNAPFITIRDINTDEITIISRMQDLESFPSFVLEMLKQNGLLGTSEKEIYDNDKFYQAYILDGKVYLKNKINKEVITYNSIDEMNEDFISLEGFINNALYIGRAFSSQMDEQELLYTYDGLYLIRIPFTDEYYIIDKNNPRIEDYKIGDILPYYYEKNEIYRSITKQELLNGKGR